MANFVIITEKPSARRNFEKALGGSQGHLAYYDYQLTNLRGHVMTLKEPADQVRPELKAKYQSWKLTDLPWDLADLSWQRTYLRSWNSRSKKMQSTKDILTDLATKAKDADGLIIATDTDPSGEGDLLAWEAINAIHWQGPVFRANFADESPKSILKALKNLTTITSQDQHGPYLKGLTRNKWDFASMQLTRAATTLTKKEGYAFVSRQGRLKSAMILKIYQQLEAIKNYQKIPFFEFRFRDENGNVYARSVDPKAATVPFRYPSAAALMANETLPATDQVQEDSVTTKTTKPPKLVDLSSLSAILAKEGFRAKEVLSTYQKMYEDQLVSYPRTEDQTITPEQFADLAGQVDEIAAVVGLDPKILTHRTPRPSHVKNQGAHGANRPGSKIPKSLNGLQKYGPSAARIYTVLAKNSLAMFAEDYHYRQIKGSLLHHPDFQTTLKVPLSLGWQAVYQDPDQASDSTMVGQNQSLGQQAQRFLHEGQNPKPSQPTWQWLKTFLEKHNIGTGATRTSTYGDLSTGKAAYIIDKKGRIDLTPAGRAVAVMAENTWLANPKTTKRVFDIFDQVGQLEMTVDQALDSIVKTVNHDIPVMVENATRLATVLGPAKKKSFSKGQESKKDKVSGDWQGTEVSFSREFSGHRFRDQEVRQLLAGQTISFPARTKRGRPYQVTGKLARQVYRKRHFVGFKPAFESTVKNKGN